MSDEIVDTVRLLESDSSLLLDENLLTITDQSVHSSPGVMWSLDRLKREIIAFNSDSRVKKLRQEFRNKRRQTKELSNYAICLAEF